MNKKTNTILFILGGTVFNIFITILCFIVILIIYARFLHPVLPQSSMAWIIPLNFIASIAASFLIYRKVIKIIMKKIDMEKYFDPIFGRPRPPRRNQ